ncbi:MAG: cation transporter, partial [Candidatus Diapherotrites archaeon]|nr:cation transporter [Candidatus Diapherotrites archaeon]
MAKAIDPICKMAVDTKTARFFSEAGGKKTYFCSRHCKEVFEARFKSSSQKQKTTLAPVFSDEQMHQSHETTTESKISPSKKTGKAIFAISGMHCANCANTIEKAVKKVRGVVDASVNFASEKATVEFDAQNCNENEIAKAINATGYKVIGQKSIQQKSAEHSEHMQVKKSNEEVFDPHALAHAVEEKELLLKVKIGSILGFLVMLGSFPEFFPVASIFSPLAILNDPRVLMVLTLPIQFWVGKTFYDGAFIAA